jgi:hypothetical protein
MRCECNFGPYPIAKVVYRDDSVIRQRFLRKQDVMVNIFVHMAPIDAKKAARAYLSQDRLMRYV